MLLIFSFYQYMHLQQHWARASVAGNDMACEGDRRGWSETGLPTLATRDRTCGPVRHAAAATLCTLLPPPFPVQTKSDTVTTSSTSTAHARLHQQRIASHRSPSVRIFNHLLGAGEAGKEEEL